MIRRRAVTFEDQMDGVKFEKSWFEQRPYLRWLPAWVNPGITMLTAWHVDPWMGQHVRRHH